ncbi:hypothetical protein E2C01_097888 [Portunus trituberculatus]|uniref:Uncharacterized protein n=1 Tax=Portunus trituberculatus TaxID=210409 RepID=A0A5B7JZT4_PORTR|nr:hypothetical protein [Portunus trituberculatus]
MSETLQLPPRSPTALCNKQLICTLKRKCLPGKCSHTGCLFPPGVNAAVVCWSVQDWFVVRKDRKAGVAVQRLRQSREEERMSLPRQN